MAVLVSEVVDAVLAAADSDAGPQLIAGWCSERYRELTNRAKFHHLLRIAELITPAVLTDGTVTVTASSALVVGDATARAKWTANHDDVIGRYFRVDGQRNWFRVAGVQPSGDLRLESPYVIPFATAPASVAGAAYKLVARFQTLADDVRHLGIISHQRLLTPLEEISHQEMDEAMAGRVLVADIPRYWSAQGVDADGKKRIEIYPYAKTDQLIRYSYTAFSPALTLDSRLPLEIDLHIMKAGVLVDLFRWEMVQAMRKNQPEIAATWRNEMNTLATRWDEKIREAVKADKASDTASFQMNTSGFPASDDRRVRNAYDYMWQKGNRP
jgi:hypothetical protein